jgi:hypothetical protein
MLASSVPLYERQEQSGGYAQEHVEGNCTSVDDTGQPKVDGAD